MSGNHVMSKNSGGVRDDHELTALVNTMRAEYVMLTMLIMLSWEWEIRLGGNAGGYDINPGDARDTHIELC